VQPAEPILATQLAVPPPARSGRLGVAELYASLAAASYAVARFLPVLDLHYQCPFRLFLGIPCASCGMTHAFVYLAHGHVADAFRWSPLGAALAAAVWAFAVADGLRVAAGWPLPALPAPLARRLLLGGAAALLANWAYLLLHGLGP
jgi:hypothetical protein